MRKKFILASDAITDDQKKQIKDALAPAGWWLWLPNFWLINDLAGNLDVTKIRDIFGRVNSEARCMVFEVDHKDWAGRTRPGPNGQSMIEWLQNNWTNP